MSKKVPCSTCPWRLTSTVGGFDIPGFDINKMRGLRSTVGAGDGFREVFACHWSEDGNEKPCVGYIAVEGWSNLTVRVMAMRGRVDINGILDACADIPMWPDFETMLAAYEEAHDGSLVAEAQRPGSDGAAAHA